MNTQKCPFNECTGKCESPFKISERQWCYDERFGLSRLIVGPETYKIKGTTFNIITLGGQQMDGVDCSCDDDVEDC